MFDSAQMARELGDSGRRYQQLVGGTKGFLFRVETENGRAVRTVHYPGVEQVTGYTPEDYWANPFLWLFMIPPDDRAIVLAQAEQALRGEDAAPIEHRIRRKDGALRWVRNTSVPVHDANGHLLGYEGLIFDITERRMIEDELQASELRYRRLFESAKDGILLLSFDTGRILDVNPFLMELLGYAKEDFIGKDLSEIGLFADIKSAQRAREELQKTGYLRYEDLPLVTKDGRTLATELISNVYHTHTSNGKIIQCNIRDITMRKQMEAEREALFRDLQRSNAEWEQFAFIASHDLHEPLRMIASYVQLLQKRYQGALDKNADQYIDYVVSGAKRMQALLDDLLIYSRAGAHQQAVDVVDVRAVVDDAIANLRMAIADSRGRVLVSEDLPSVRGDPVQLQQVFQNLIANALKFHREGVTPEVAIAGRVEHGSPVFTVQDNGIGINPQQQERLFQIFQRLHPRDKYPGRGIGLAICKRIVERHGGRIWVESEPDKGAMFCLSMPASVGERSAA